MKSTLLLGAIGIAVGGFVGYNYGYVPQQTTVRLIDAQLAQEQSNQNTGSDVAVLLKDLERRSKRLAPEADSSWLAREVVALAQQAGVEVTTMTQDPPQVSPQVTRLGVNLEFNASYHLLGSFIDQLEQGKAFMRVDRLELSEVPGQKGVAMVRLAVSSFYLPMPSRAAQ